MLGSQLDKVLKDRKLSLSQLARESRIPKATLHGWITGQRSVDPDQVRRVAECLRIPVYELLFGAPDPNGPVSQIELEDLFSGDVRISVQRIRQKRG